MATKRDLAEDIMQIYDVNGVRLNDDATRQRVIRKLMREPKDNLETIIYAADKKSDPKVIRDFVRACICVATEEVLPR